MSKRVLAMALAILAFFIFVGSPFQQAAQAVAVISTSLLAIIVLALAAVGITFVTTGSFSNSSELVESLIGECATYNGVTVETLTNGIQSGTNKLGQILLNNRFVQFIDTLAKYIRYKYNLVNNSHVTIRQEGMAMGEVMLYNLPVTVMSGNSHEGYTTEMYIGVGYAAFVSANPSNPASVVMNIISEVPGTVEEIYIYSNGTVGSPSHRVTLSFDEVSGKYLASNYREFQSAGWKNYIVSNFTINGTADYNNYLGYNVLPTEGITINTGVIRPPLDDTGYTPGDGAIIDAGVEWGLSYGDVVDGIEDGFSYSDSLDPSITYEGEEEVSEQVEDTQAQAISQNVNDYRSPGLQTVFPFCIPFDIYAFFECLAAEPEAPSFVWRFYIPGICDEDLEIDLAAFDSAARILRTMELLLFIVGLAFVTRDKFLRG